MNSAEILLFFLLPGSKAKEDFDVINFVTSVD